MSVCVPVCGLICVCFKTEGFAIIVLCIDTGAVMCAVDQASLLRAGCGQTPTKFPQQRKPLGGREATVWWF